MKKLAFLLSLAIIGVSFLSSCKKDSQLSLDKSVYSPGETIVVSFVASPDWDKSAWIGIIPADTPHGKESVNDQYDITYQYINKATNGTMEFTAPTEPGKYDIRMHDTDDGSTGKEIASVTFEVK